MGGGGTVDVPQPSAEERELQREQTALLRQQRDILSEQIRQQNLLAPILYDSAGIKPIQDDEGKIIGFEKVEDELSGLREEIEEGLLNRSLAALKGELPVNPAITNDLTEAESQLRESLRKSLGPDYETSTPGSRRLSDFFETKEDILEGSRRGDLSLAEGLSLARAEGEDARLANFFNRVTGTTQFQGSSLPGLSSLVQGYQQPLALRQQDRNLQLQAQMQNSAAGSQNIVGGISGITTAATLAAMIY